MGKTREQEATLTREEKAKGKEFMVLYKKLNKTANENKNKIEKIKIEMKNIFKTLELPEQKKILMSLPLERYKKAVCYLIDGN